MHGARHIQSPTFGDTVWPELGQVRPEACLALAGTDETLGKASTLTADDFCTDYIRQRHR